MCIPTFKWLSIYGFMGMLASCLPLAPTVHQNKAALALRDTIYDPHIKSVRFYPFLGGRALETSSPVLALGTKGRLRLDFDVLSKQQDIFYAILIPCTAIWKRSPMPTMTFLEGINLFPLQDVRPVLSTRIPYIHYRFDVPPVRVSGNYVLHIQRGDMERTPVLSLRFTVYESLTKVVPRIERSRRLAARADHHRLSFSLDYKGLSLSYPHRDLYVAIRQNQQWGRMRQGIKPTRLREVEYVHEYDHANGESDFKALHGFRTFDIRHATFKGRHVAHTLRDSLGLKVVLEVDRSRKSSSFRERRDLDGHYFPYDEGVSHADYVQVQFRLDAQGASMQQVHVVGSFNLWARGEENRMRYDSTTHLYTATLWLQEGYYDYLYHVQGEDPYTLEGYHAQANNAYEIFVYFKDVSARRDRLVGYTYISGRP